MLDVLEIKRIGEEDAEMWGRSVEGRAEGRRCFIFK